jgi:shikimate kinase / 3-dehydroquinate synthase
MKENIYITGFMGAGKSAVAQTLAKFLKRRFIDMDEVISRKSGMSVASYFEQFGENKFRQAETVSLSEIARQNRVVVATGGGTPIRSENRSMMRDSGTIVCLQVPLKDCMTRLSSAGSMERPLWKDVASVKTLFDSRRQAYEDCDLKIDTSDKTPEQLAREICEKLEPPRTTNVNLAGSEHPLIISWRAPCELPEILKTRKKIVLTDKRISKFHMDRYAPILEDATIVALRPGERSKTLGTARRLYEVMLKDNMGRDGLLIAIGGGVVTDLGAFVASTYKRGIPFILVSTSLVGCVDAAIGGKAAVDLKAVKNPVGCFSSPSCVILDLTALGTLPSRCLTEGLVEAYKTGLVANNELAGIIETDINPLLRGDMLCLARIVKLSALTKVEIVGKDFKETGLRRILNFGHTYGHAVESFSNYRLSHGTAVAVGMMVAISLSGRRGLLSSAVSESMLTTLSRFVAGPVLAPPIEIAWAIMMNDKKNRNGRVNFVLLEGVSSPIYVDDVTPDELAKAVREVEAFKNG